MNYQSHLTKNYTQYIFFIIFFAWSFTSNATHIVGGDITYRFLERMNGQNKYEIILTVRRDCSKTNGKDLNEPFDRNAVITIFQDLPNNKKSVFQILKIAKSTTFSIDDVIESDCGFEGSQICYEQTKYEAIVFLPDNPAGGYTFVYQRCCRNGTLNNIINPLNTGATYFTEISKFAFDNQNSSPRFEKWPNVYMCVNEPYNFEFKALDTDGDSLVYKLCIPKAGLDSITPIISDANPVAPPPYPEIIFQPPYNINNIMNLAGGTPLQINSMTGLLTAIPDIVGQYVLTVCVEEYRNGQKIGEIRRDLQYNTRICTTPPTAIINAPSSLCNEKTITFGNGSLASDNFEWNFNYPSNNPSFKSNEKNPTFTFPGNGDYKIFLKVIRGSDKCADSIVQNIHVTDLPYNANFTYDIITCNMDGSISVILSDSSYTEDAGVFSTKWSWKLTQNGLAQTDTIRSPVFTIQPGDFDVEFNVMASNACSGSIARTVDFETKILETDFKVELTGCDPDNKLKIMLIDLSQQINDNYIITERKWKVVGANGIAEFTGDSVEITMDRQPFDVSLDINTNKFCRASSSQTFVPSDFIPSADFVFDLSGCDLENQAIIRFTEQSNDTTAYAAVSKYEWIYRTNTETGKVLDVVTNLRDSFEMKLQLTFADNCTAIVSKAIDVDELRPKVAYDYVAAECPTDLSVKLQFVFNNELTRGLGNDTIKWNIGNATDINLYKGDTLSVTVPKDSLIFTSLYTLFQNGCRDTFANQFVPGPYSTLHIITDSLVLCPGETKTLIENGNPAFDYFWSPQVGLDLTNPANPVLTAIEDKTYTVTVSDGLCQVSGSISVNVLETIQLFIDGENYTCDGSVSLTALGAVGPGEYIWSDQPGMGPEIAKGVQLDTQFSKDSIIYYVRFKGEVCSAVPAQIQIKNEAPKLEVISPFKFCIGDTIKTNNVINKKSTHVNNLVWKPDPHLIDLGNGYNITVGTTGPEDKDFKLYFDATNQFGCTLSDSLSFEIIKNPVVDFDFQVRSCDTFDVCFQLNGALNGFPRWDFGDPASGINNNSINPSDCHQYPGPGSYVVKLINISELCPFKDVLDTIVLNSSYPVFTTEKDESCTNVSYTLNLPAAAQGLDFVWFNGDGTFLSTDANPSVNIGKDTFYILQVKDENGCAFKDTIFIDAFEFTFDFDVRDTVCATGEYPISVISQQGVNFLYQWGPSNGIVFGQNTATIIADVAKSGSYQVTLTHPTLGCKEEKNVNLNKFNFEHELSLPEIFCLNQEAVASINVSGNIGYIYDWQPSSGVVSGGNTSSATIKVTGEQEFFVNVIHPTLGCRLRDSFLVEPTFLTLSLAASPNTTVSKGQLVEISVDGVVTGWKYEWSNGITGEKQSVIINESTTFIVTATDANGCTGEAEIRIDVRPPQCAEDVFIPTAFSPNGDDNNDVLMVRSNYITDMELIIYNRWGQEVFSTKDQKTGWDGRFNGEELAPDVYAYWLKARCEDNDEIIKRGNVSLLR